MVEIGVGARHPWHGKKIAVSAERIERKMAMEYARIKSPI
jgi:hypothetical protein